MGLDHGSGVSRTLSPLNRAWASVIWQKGKPPLDAELNLMSSVELERMREYVSALMPSGFLMDPTRAQFDYRFNKLWANHFHLGVPRAATGSLDSDETQPVVWANVNGWIIPVAGTDVTGAADVHNVVKLYPPPGSDSRVDFVFLEAWATLVQPNPSTTNKPTASTIWKYGNVKHGGTNITDDLEDPTIGVETTKRVQVQYRIRVYGSGEGGGASVNLAAHPDGFGDPNILGQGAASAVVAGMQWTNMRESLGDSSLWRAGDGNPNNALGTIDGYTYAIPICAVFRRNRDTFVAVTQTGNPTQNGATLRTPGSYLLVNPLDGAVPLLQASLGEFLGPDDGLLADHTVQVTNLNGSGLEDSAHVLSNIFLRIDDEIVGIKAVNLVNGTITIPAGGRGRWGTAATGHDTGALIRQFNTRPDGLYCDEIAAQDVLDLRRAVNPGDWDYSRLLSHNVASLVRGNLRTAWKESNPGDTEGVTVFEVAEMYAANEQHPNHTDPVDGPDGIRTIWSDAATIQPDVTLLLKHDATRDADGRVGFTNNGFDVDVDWDVGADLSPIGFMNTGGLAAGWYNGSSIHLFIGGQDGEGGARGTFRASGVRDVRFVTPQEFWKSGYPTVDPATGNQHPITLRFLGEKATSAPPTALDENIRAGYPGPMYPWRDARFESPFLVLGGILHSNLHLTGVATANLTSAADAWGTTRYYLDLTGEGLDFNTDGTFFKKTGGVFQNDPSLVTVPLLGSTRTLYGMLTDNGKDLSGASSEVYLVLHGDPTGRNNNGAFRVIGAGSTAGYTRHNGSAAGMLVLEPLSADFAGFDANANEVTVDFRSQWHNANDINSYAGRLADLVVVLTDIGGEGSDGSPWDQANLPGAIQLAQEGGAGPYYAPSKAVLSTTLLYHPGRSATTRVADEIVRVAMRGGSEETLGTYLRRSPSGIDTTFSAIGTATNETYWPPAHVQTWNRLSGLGWHAPNAPAYGGSVVGYTEQDREHEVFVDRGSKTLLLRPFRNRAMTLKALTWTDLAPDCLLGSYLYPDLAEKDPIQILTGGNGTTGKRMGFQVPQEFMPRFGRQDIPYYQLTPGTAPRTLGFMPGINHLFTDVTDVTSPVFNIIGGERNTGGSQVKSLFLGTRPSGGSDPAMVVAYGQTSGAFGPKAVAAYGARKTTDIDPNTGADARAVIAALNAVNSSDFGRGLKGIQLPPYMGIARLYGVYEMEDYRNKGGTAFDVDRYTMEADSATNLLREDADQQTLFILRDGARDLTGELDDHTYIIPSNVLDLTRIPLDPGGAHQGYQEGVSKFEDFDYVVECCVFFFAKGFINGNNVVLVRERNGSFGLNTDGDDAELENVQMCIPAPAGVNDRFYVGYNRTVYQGDPFMTRAGATRQEADYENRYGRLTPVQAHLLRTPVQQFDSAGDFVPQRDNDRAFEVLASMDFYTTLGTGKIGGDLFPGTILDVGHIHDDLVGSSRMPLTSTSNDWRVDVRAFTEGQKENTSRARATLEILNNEALYNANEHGYAFRVKIRSLDGTETVLYGVRPTRQAAFWGVGTGVVAADTFTVDEASKTKDVLYDLAAAFAGVTLTPANPTATVVIPKATYDAGNVLSLTQGKLFAEVMANAAHTNGNGGVVFQARAAANGDVTVTAIWTGSYYQVDGPNTTIFDTNQDFANILAGASETINIAVAGVLAGDLILVQPHTESGPAINPLIYTAYSSLDGQVSLVATNPTAAPINDAARDYRIIVLRNVDPTTVAYAFGAGALMTIWVKQETGDKNVTADNLVGLINSHASLTRTIKAFNDGTPKITLEAIPVGAEGNDIRVEVDYFDVPTIGDLVPAAPVALPVEQTFRLEVSSNNALLVGHQTTGTNLFGGIDLPVNAGNGTNQVALTGMTERLPLGVLVQDSDFLCENPLGDTASAMNSAVSLIRPIQTLMPMTDSGEEYTRFMGSPGELVAMADVTIAPYSWQAWTEGADDGATKKFRIYRGGGAAFVLSGDNPGGPIDWVTESFPKSSQPVVKGGVLACRAMLVRNFYEEAFAGGSLAAPSQGDEIQLVILTHAHLGNGNTVQEGMTLDGIISPSGYGEGYAAADRYRCMGRPMIRGYSRYVPDPSQVVLAVYPEDERGT